MEQKKPKKRSKKPKCGIKRFYLLRNEDESGVSGTGIIAEVIELSNGRCVLSWLSPHHSITIFDNLKELMEIHSHGGKTVLKSYDSEKGII